MRTIAGDGHTATPEQWRRRALAHWRRDRPREAMAAAWSAFDLAGDDRSTQRLLLRLLRLHPDELLPQRSAGYLRLLTDGDNDPQAIDAAGWGLLVRSCRLAEEAGDTELAALADRLEHDRLALALLREAPVGHPDAEHLLTRIRRWLLLTRQWRHYPALSTALRAQAALNGGAWPFQADEQARLGEPENGPLLPAYLPLRESRSAVPATTADPVTRAVAAQYEGWPYPAWTRITRPHPTTLPARVRGMDPALAASLPVAASILVAGCGSGREAALIARRYPDATVTGIDVSAASLDYAQRQCAAAGIANVRFRQLDLCRAARLGERFHAIHCSGVLHHLADPERGWRRLTEVLEPAGVMRIMLYNKTSRLPTLAARNLLGELAEQPIDDDLLRQARGALLQRRAHPLLGPLIRSRDFATLAGTHDLLLHRHEDPFDLPRIERALAQLGLTLLQFDLPSPAAAARYDAQFSRDPGHRDIASLIRFSRHDLAASWGNFSFWCGRTP